MLLRDFITVALIPTLMHANPLEVTSNERAHIGYYTRPLNSRRLPLPRSFEEDEILGEDGFFNGNNPSSFPYHNKIQDREENRGQFQSMVADPILREIYGEENILNLAGEDIDVRSKETRKLISLQRRKSNKIQNLGTQTDAGTVFSLMAPQGRSMFFESRYDQINGDDYIVIKHPTMENNEASKMSELTTTATTPLTSRLAIPDTFSKVTESVGNVHRNVRDKIRGSSNLQTTTATTSQSSNSINFQNEDKSYQEQENHGPNPIVFKDDVEVLLKCTEMQTKYNGTCYNVLQQLPCSAGKWLIEDDNTGMGKCVENKCANKQYHAYFDGKCVVVRSEEGDHCPKGMVPYIFKNGRVQCDCKLQYLFNNKDGNCYPAYRRGPCISGKIFVARITETGTSPATCVPSQCSQDGFFCLAPKCPKDRNCIALKSNCPAGQWDIHPDTLTPACLGFNVFLPDRVIGNVPTLACAPGSRRDILGTCRKPSRITFS